MVINRHYTVLVTYDKVAGCSFLSLVLAGSWGTKIVVPFSSSLLVLTNLTKFHTLTLASVAL
jgi:hypothetical protein